MASKTLIITVLVILLCLLTPTTVSGTSDIVETKDGYMIIYENEDTYFVDTLKENQQPLKTN